MILRQLLIISLLIFTSHSFGAQSNDLEPGWYAGHSQIVNTAHKRNTVSIDNKVPNHGWSLFAGYRFTDLIGMELYSSTFDGMSINNEDLSVLSLSYTALSLNTFFNLGDRVLGVVKLGYGSSNYYVEYTDGLKVGNVITVNDNWSGKGYNLSAGILYQITRNWSAGINYDLFFADIDVSSPVVQNGNTSIATSSLSGSIIFTNFRGLSSDPYAGRKALAGIAGGVIGAAGLVALLSTIENCPLYCDVNNWPGAMLAIGIGGSVGAKAGVMLVSILTERKVRFAANF